MDSEKEVPELRDHNVSSRPGMLWICELRTCTGRQCGGGRNRVGARMGFQSVALWALKSDIPV